MPIVSADPTFTASAWNGAYEDVAITGYSSMTTENQPALPERILLIEVYNFATTANLINSTIDPAVSFPGHTISPAPSYTINGSGQLQASYGPDATTYATNAFTPSAYFEVENALIASGNKKFLRIKVNPLQYNPVTSEVQKAPKIVLDIGLDSAGWGMTPPGAGDVINPFNVANTLRIDYTQAGMYQLDYADLVDSNIEGPFDGVDVNDFRLYVDGVEHPLEVYSPGGNFTTGDYLRFYLPYTATLEDNKNRVKSIPIWSAVSHGRLWLVLN